MSAPADITVTNHANKRHHRAVFFAYVRSQRGADCLARVLVTGVDEGDRVNIGDAGTMRLVVAAVRHHGASVEVAA